MSLVIVSFLTYLYYFDKDKKKIIFFEENKIIAFVSINQKIFLKNKMFVFILKIFSKKIQKKNINFKILKKSFSF